MKQEQGSELINSYICSKCGLAMKTNGPIPTDSICNLCRLPAKERQAIAEQMKQDLEKNLNWNKK